MKYLFIWNFIFDFLFFEDLRSLSDVSVYLYDSIREYFNDNQLLLYYYFLNSVSNIADKNIYKLCILEPEKLYGNAVIDICNLLIWNYDSMYIFDFDSSYSKHSIEKHTDDPDLYKLHAHHKFIDKLISLFHKIEKNIEDFNLNIYNAHIKLFDIKINFNFYIINNQYKDTYYMIYKHLQKDHSDYKNDICLYIDDMPYLGVIKGEKLITIESFIGTIEF